MSQAKTLTVQEIKEKYKIRGSPTEGLIAATVGFFIGFAAVVAMGATIKALKDPLITLGYSAFWIGLLVAMPNLSGSLLRIPFSAWTDQVGGRKPFLVLLTLSLVGLLGLTLFAYLFYNNLEAIHYWILLILAFLAGCGVATFSVGISQVSFWFPQKEQGKALGTYAGLGNTAPGIFSLVMALSLGFFATSPTNGLMESYLLWFLLLLVGTTIYYFIGLDAWSFQLKEQGVPEDEAVRIAKEAFGQEIIPAHALVKSLKISASNWKTWALVVFYFTSFGGFIALAAWFPNYWNSYFFAEGASVSFFGLKINSSIDLLGIALAIALIFNAIFVIIGSLVRVYSGNLADKITGERTVLGGFLIILVGAIIMMFATDGLFPLAFLGMVVISTGMGVVNAGVFKLVPKYVSNAVGGAAGWVGGLGAFGGFVIPPIMGAFVDTFGSIGYAWGFVTFAVLALICLVVLYVLTQNNKQ